MPRPEQDPDDHDALTDGDRSREEITRNGNPGKPQSEYLTPEDLTPPPGPAEQQGSELSVGPTDQD